MPARMLIASLPGHSPQARLAPAKARHFGVSTSFAGWGVNLPVPTICRVQNLHDITAAYFSGGDPSRANARTGIKRLGYSMKSC